MATQSKTSRLVRSYKSVGSDTHTPRVTETVESIHFAVADGAKSVDAVINSFPAGIQRAAMAYGLNATIGNALGNLDEKQLDDPDQVLDAIRERIQSLQAGKWAGERTGGGRPSIVWMAFQAWRSSKGVKDTPEKLEALHKNWFEDEGNFKKLQANPEFAKFLVDFKASRKAPAATVASADLLA